MAGRARSSGGTYLPTHGQRRTRLYAMWSRMRSRCSNPNVERYPIYGGRGVTVCKEWDDFNRFYSWAVANGYSDDLQIDRIDTNGNYQPSNCRFVTCRVNQNNRRNNNRVAAFGEEKTVAEWGRDQRCLVSTDLLYQRLRRDIAPESAMTMPLRAGSSLLKRERRHGGY